jgi:hypothetical protein
VDLPLKVLEFVTSQRIAIDSCCFGERICGTKTFLPPRLIELVPNQGLALKKAAKKRSDLPIS